MAGFSASANGLTARLFEIIYVLQWLMTSLLFSGSSREAREREQRERQRKSLCRIFPFSISQIGSGGTPYHPALEEGAASQILRYSPIFPDLALGPQFLGLSWLMGPDISGKGGPPRIRICRCPKNANRQGDFADLLLFLPAIRDCGGICAVSSNELPVLSLEEARMNRATWAERNLVKTVGLPIDPIEQLLASPDIQASPRPTAPWLSLSLLRRALR
jgi:hypothetical protein